MASVIRVASYKWHPEVIAGRFSQIANGKSTRCFAFVPSGLVVLLFTAIAAIGPLEANSGAALPSIFPAPTGVYALKKLIPEYSGPALRVQRVSDGAQRDVGFSGADLDVSTAIAFRGDSTLRVMTFYDQTGRNNHLTQDVPNNQPFLYLNNGGPVLVFPGYLKIPSTLTADRANVSMFAVMREVSSNVSGNIFSMGPAQGPIDLGLHGLVSCFATQPAYDGKFAAVIPNDASTVATATPAVVGLVSSPEGITIHRDGKTGTSAAVTSKTMRDGGVLGALPDMSSREDIFAWLFYPAALNDADATAVKTSLQTVFATNSWKLSLNVVLQGDSKTFGVATPNNLTLARAVSPLLPGAVIRNLGISGKTIKEDQTKFDSARFQEPGARNILSLYEGINDLSGILVHGGDTAENIWGYYRTFVSCARAHGWDRIVCCTITPRFIGDFTPQMEAQRLLLNKWIRENKDHLFDAVADFDGIPALGTAEHPNRAYLPDGIHETEAAYALEAPVLAEAIKTAAAKPVVH